MGPLLHAAGAITLFVSLFFGWLFRLDHEGKPELATGWESYSRLDQLLALLAVAGVLAVFIERDRTRGLLQTAFGAVALVLVVRAVAGDSSSGLGLGMAVAGSALMLAAGAVQLAPSGLWPRLRSWGERGKALAHRHPLALVAGLSGAWVVLAAILQLWRHRQGRVATWEILYVEDGEIFLTDALNESFFGALFKVFPDYLVLVPRLVAEVAGALPLSWAARAMNVQTVVITALLSLFVFFRSRYLFEATWPRALLALLVVAAPITGPEIHSTAANIHWYLLFACFWAFVGPYESRWAAVAGSAVVLATTLSDPAAALFLPLAVWLARIGWRERAVVVLFLAGLGAQFVAQLTSADTDPRNLLALHSYFEIYGVRVIADIYVGDHLLADAWRDHHWKLVYVTVAITGAALAIGLWRLGWRKRVWLGVLVVNSFAFFALSMYIRGQEGELPHYPDLLVYAGSRYMYAPILFLMTALLLVCDRLYEERRGWHRQAVALVVCAVTLSIVAENYKVDFERQNDPGFRAHLIEARGSQCQSDEPTATVAGAPSSFSITVPCDRFRDEEADWDEDWLPEPSP